MYTVIDRLKLKQIDPVKPACIKCFDKGYVLQQEGSHTGASRCSCLLDAIQKQRFDALIVAGNMEDYAHMTFESFKPITPKQKIACEAMRDTHRGYYLFGSWGVGKTHLMAASAVRQAKAGMAVTMLSVPRLLDTIRKRGRAAESADVEMQAYSIPYLCLDDIGKQKDSDWTEERLFMLMDERWKLYQSGKCHTSLTSQYPLEELKKKMDGAIIDRIRGMCREQYIDGKSMR